MRPASGCSSSESTCEVQNFIYIKEEPEELSGVFGADEDQNEVYMKVKEEPEEVSSALL